MDSSFDPRPPAPPGWTPDGRPPAAEPQRLPAPAPPADGISGSTFWSAPAPGWDETTMASPCL